MSTTASQNCPQCGAPLSANAPAGLCPRCVMAMNLATQTDFADGSGQPRTSSFIPPTPEEIAARFPQLEILELLGRGGMGAVYKARQKDLDRIVALKILPPGIGDDRAFADRFVREAKALAKLNHPNIVTLYEFDQTDGLFYFMMEFVDGVNLRQLLQAGRLAPREALAIVPQICDALQYAHDHGIVHRDIKPENILLDRKGQVKVADFGVARLMGIEGEMSAVESGQPGSVSVSLTEAGSVMGTPQYMAPEQKTNPTEVDHRADIYSLGVVFYQMLTGELPGKRIESPSRRVHLDVRLDEVVLRALEQKPQLRYQQASEMKERVETIAQSPTRSPAPAVAQSAALPQTVPPWRTGWKLAAFVGVLALCWFAILYLKQKQLGLVEGQINVLQNSGAHPIAPSNSSPSFGPVIERTITNAIDLDTGKLIDLKTNTEIRIAELEGVDAFVEGGVLFGLGMDILPVPDMVSHGAPADEIVSRLKAGMYQLVVKMEMHGNQPPGTYAGSYIFKTRDGSTGVLQVIAVTEDPHAIKIRYKLVHSGAPASNTNELSNLGNSPSKPDYVSAQSVFYAIAGIAELLDAQIKEQHDPKLAAEIASQLVDRVNEYNRLVEGTEVEVPHKCLTAWSKLPDTLRAGKWDDAASLLSVGSKDKRLLEPLQELARRQTESSSPSFGSGHEFAPRQTDYAKALQAFYSAVGAAIGLSQAIDKRNNPGLASDMASRLLLQLRAYNESVAGTPVELPQQHIDELATVPEELKAGNWDDAKTALGDGLIMNDDLLSRLQQLSEQQTQQSVQGVSLHAAKFDGPTGVAVDSSGNLYVADFFGQTLREIATNGLVTTLAGNGLIIGQNGVPEGGYADGLGTAARFCDPFGVAVDAAGNIYVGDFGNDSVRKISPTGMVSTLAGLPGTPGSTDGTGSAARFRRPHGVALDSAGNIYVADTDNDTIRKVTPSGMVITFAGKAGEHGNVDGRGGDARFNSPHGVAIDRAGSVFVADTDNHTIRRITREGVVTTLAGTPRKKGSTDGAAGKARFNGPYGVAVDDQDNLYVADTSNDTVRQIALAGTNWVVTTLAGQAGTGGHEDGTGSAARFSTPDGLAVDGRGNIYVADESNRTIRKLTRAGTTWVVTDLLRKQPDKKSVER